MEKSSFPKVRNLLAHRIIQLRTGRNQLYQGAGACRTFWNCNGGGQGAVYFASDESTFAVGSELMLDGGMGTL
jgi:hypothetical protein